MEFDSYSIDLHHRISSPTCEDLGIPRDLGRDLVNTRSSGSETSPTSLGRLFRPAPGGSPGPNFDGHVLTIDGLKYEIENPNNPFSPFCQIPIPNPYASYECGFEPAFIRKRNERERERVRGVNDGYMRLRNHLPLIENKEKRISKVETLRAAIKYIKHLQTLLSQLDKTEDSKSKSGSHGNKKKLELKASGAILTGTDADMSKIKAKPDNQLSSDVKEKRKPFPRDD